MSDIFYLAIVCFIFISLTVWIICLHQRINSLTNDVKRLLNDNYHIIRYIKFKDQGLDVKMRFEDAKGN
jgi:hypothetical protein